YFGVSPTKPTILFYNHYDVQPPDPLSEWVTGPFTAEIRSGRLFGRGAVDNKGNLIARFSAIKSFLDTGQALPVNIKFLIDGAEEIGSPGLVQFIEKYRSKLDAEFCIWELGKTNEKGAPELSLGVKGILYLELYVKGPKEDLHSSRGIIIPNSAWRLNWALSSLKASDERILINGFYDDCLKPTADDIRILSNNLLNEPKTKKEVGIKSFLLNLSGRDLLKRYFYQPALNINGITTGYQGPGHKTVLPKEASAKIDFRLVPEQRPDDIVIKLRRHLDLRGFRDVKIVSSHGYPPARTPLNHPTLKKYLAPLNKLARKTYGKDFIIEPLSPASGPMYLFTSVLKMPCLAMGIGRSDSNLHAPNENIIISDYI
ncbi:MAG: M20/M25/M40 family metallo-hydrolase, partial [Planctomycetota bacterium]|nr:M20/M25/M40 family metallo-hydrolase [Planctomycetota bacterium]